MNDYDRDEREALRQAVRFGNPLKRMRAERRVALLIFNALLLAAALMQLLGSRVTTANGPAPLHEKPPPVIMEFEE